MVTVANCAPGYPVTTAGEVHLAVAFLGAVVGTIVLSIDSCNSPGLRTLYPWLPGISVAALVPLLLLDHGGFSVHSLAGLYERAFLGLELLWIFIVGLRLAQTSPNDPGATTALP